MRIKKNGIPYARRRKSWEIPFPKRREKGYPKYYGRSYTNYKTKALTKAEAETIAIFSAIFLFLLYVTTMAAGRYIIRHFTTLKEECHQYPIQKKSILKRQASLYSFLGSTLTILYIIVMVKFWNYENIILLLLFVLFAVTNFAIFDQLSAQISRDKEKINFEKKSQSHREILTLDK